MPTGLAPVGGPGAGGLGVASQRKRRLSRLAVARGSFAVALGALAVFAFLAVAMYVFVMPIAGVAGLFAFVGLLAMMVPSGLEGEVIYPAGLPLRTLFRAGDLGARSAKDVVSAEIIKERLQGYSEYTTLWVTFAGGGVANFGGNTGVPVIDPAEMAAVKDPEMRAAFEGVVEERAADVRAGIDWLSAHGIAVQPATPRATRRRAKRWARQSIAAGLVFMAGIPVAYGLWAVGLVSFTLAATGGLGSAGMGAFLLYLSVTLKWSGAAATDEGLFRPELSFRELYQPEAFGLVPTEAVESCELHKAGLLAGPSKWVLEVKVRGGRPLRVLDKQDEVGFKAVREWLSTHEIPERRIGG